MIKPQIIACDIDGTLLRGEQTALLPETVKLIRRIVDAGIVFMPASGRQHAGLKWLFASVQRPLPYVAENGTFAFLDDECVFRVQMDRTLGDELVREISSMPECQLLVSGERTSYIQENEPSYYEFLTTHYGYNITAIEDATTIPEPYSKISAHYRSGIPDDAFWKERYGARCSVAESGNGWVDMTPLKTTKATGVLAICEQLSIDPARCLAIGDADNDVGMFEIAGYSVVMDSARPDVKTHANESTPSAEAVFERVLANA